LPADARCRCFRRPFDIEQILEALDRHGVDYLVVGGVAASAYVPRSLISAYERDVRQPTMATLLRLLKAAGYELRRHLAPYDERDAVLAERRAAWPVEDQERWEAYHRARIDAGQATLRAEERKLLAKARG